MVQTRTLFTSSFIKRPAWAIWTTLLYMNLVHTCFCGSDFVYCLMVFEKHSDGQNTTNMSCTYLPTRAKFISFIVALWQLLQPNTCTKLIVFETSKQSGPFKKEDALLLQPLRARCCLCRRFFGSLWRHNIHTLRRRAAYLWLDSLSLSLYI